MGDPAYLDNEEALAQGRGIFKPTKGHAFFEDEPDNVVHARSFNILVTRCGMDVFRLTGGLLALHPTIDPTVRDEIISRVNAQQIREAQDKVAMEQVAKFHPHYLAGDIDEGDWMDFCAALDRWFNLLVLEDGSDLSYVPDVPPDFDQVLDRLYPEE